MPNVEYALASGHSVRYLDVAPMIASLRFQPSDFEYAHGWLHHVPSRHRFQFDRKGRVTVDALCGCAAMSVRPEQADELHSMFKTWRQHYWVPMETEPRVRVALQRAERVGETVPRYADGLAALPARGGAGDHSGGKRCRRRRRNSREARFRNRSVRCGAEVPFHRNSRGAGGVAGVFVVGARWQPEGGRGDLRQTIPDDEPATAGRSFALTLPIARRPIDGDRIERAAAAHARFRQDRRNVGEEARLQKTVSRARRCPPARRRAPRGRR